MKKQYKVHYTFDGYGSAIIEAESPEEAEEKFESGDYDANDEKEKTSNYEIDMTENWNINTDIPL